MRRGLLQRLGWPVPVIIVGSLIVIGAAVYGFVRVGSVGQGELDTVPLGEQIDFVPSGSYRASIYITRALDTVPACEVTTSTGNPVRLRSGTPYNVNTRYNMEAAYGFHLESGVPSYVVRCGNPGEPGSFAVVEISPTPQRIAIALGVTGAVVIAVGALAAILRRRAQRRAGTS